jgi:Uma2 family endonuclease
MVEVVEKKHSSARSITIPDNLIYEQWNGKPIYYHGYRDVLAGLKRPEEIMSCSDIQGALIALIIGYLFTTIDRKKYIVRTNEVGLNLSKGNNLALDIAISEREPSEQLTGKFLKVSPKVVIEIDIKADFSNLAVGEMDYLLRKSKKIIDFGAESVLWILTASKTVVVISKNDSNPYIANWDQNIFLLDEHFINIQDLLNEEGISW